MQIAPFLPSATYCMSGCWRLSALQDPGSSLLTDVCPHADPDAHCAEECQNVLSVLDCAAEPECLLLAHQHCGGCWVRRRHHPRHPRLCTLSDCCLRRRIPDSSHVCLRYFLRLTLEHQRPCKQQLEGQVPFASSSQTSLRAAFGTSCDTLVNAPHQTFPEKVAWHRRAQSGGPQGFALAQSTRSTAIRGLWSAERCLEGQGNSKGKCRPLHTWCDAACFKHSSTRKRPFWAINESSYYIIYSSHSLNAHGYL